MKMTSKHFTGTKTDIGTETKVLAGSVLKDNMKNRGKPTGEMLMPLVSPFGKVEQRTQQR